MAKEFDYAALDFEARAGIHEALATTTLKHIDAGGGLFKASPFDPAANPSHMLETTHLHPLPTTREHIDSMANVAGPTIYPYIQATLDNQRGLMSALRMLMEDGKNIAVVTGPHGNIADIAFFQAGYGARLDQRHWQEQCGLIISRGVTTIDAFGTAASQVMQNAGHVFMSFPRTKTIEDLVIASNVLSREDFESLIETNNRNMRREARDWLEIDIRHRLDPMRRLGRQALGKTLFTAWEGKTVGTEYNSDGTLKSVQFQKVHSAIIDLLKNCAVLPVTIWDKEKPVVEIGELTTVKNTDDIARVQEWQRSTLARSLELDDEQVTIAT